jgi:hypothetical protein
MRLYIERNEKNSFTVVAAITAACKKLPPSLIVSGKTDAVEEFHFDDIGYHQTDHSESGWPTTDAFCRWPSWLRGVYDDCQLLWLILDCHSVHRQEKLKQYAAELGINLFLIPPGLTDEFQPLDRFAFGVMQSNCAGHK